MTNPLKTRRTDGYATIITVSIIAVILIMVVMVLVSIRFESQTSSTSKDSAKALYLAEAGIQDAMARIIQDARSEFIDDLNDSWAQAYSDNSLLDGLGKFEVEAKDAQRLININTAGLNLLQEFLSYYSLDTGIANDIISERPFETKPSLRRLASISASEYNQIKDYITVNSFTDSNAGGRSPVNVNTASEATITILISGLNVNAATPAAAAGAIVNQRPFANWAEFDACIDGLAISSADKETVKDNANPNRLKPTPHTTEFCFHSGGYFEIKSAGTLYADAAQSQVASRRTLSIVVKLYDFWYQTSREDFRGEDANYNGALDAGEDTNSNGVLDVPGYVRCTWFDSCPVNAESLFEQYAITEPEYIEGSIKIGYWDDFDEDPDYTQNEWTGDFTIGDADTDADDELYYATPTSWPYPVFRLQDAAKWLFNEFTIRAYEYDSLNTWQMKEVGWLMCTVDTSSGMNVGVLLAKQGPLEWGAPWFYRVDLDGSCIYSNNTSLSLWIFPPQLRRFPDGGDIDNYWVEHPEPPSAPAYQRKKTLVFRNTATQAEAACFDSEGGSSNLTFPQGSASTLTLYGQNQRPVWDDLRVVTADGSYTSYQFSPSAGPAEYLAIGYNYLLQADTALSVEVDTGSGFSAVSNNDAINTTSAYISYRLSMTSEGDFINTPVFEDIAISYRIPARIIYRTEGEI